METTKIRVAGGVIAILFSLFFLFVLGGCNEQEVDVPVSKTNVVDDPVLVRVNDSPITEYDLEQVAQRTFGIHAPERLDGDLKKELLKSLVAARAIAMKVESEMTDGEMAAVENRTQAFREELLVQEYVSKHVRPEPVTEQMIREYYESHPGEFGQNIRREYELITARKQDARERDNLLLAKLDDAGARKNWEEWVQTLSSRGFSVDYRRGEADKAVLDKRLYELMTSLDEGETSSPAFIEKRLYVARVTRIEEYFPKPFEDVREKIRRKLTPLRVKDAVRRAADEVLTEATVVWADQNGKDLGTN